LVYLLSSPCLQRQRSFFPASAACLQHCIARALNLGALFFVCFFHCLVLFVVFFFLR
jgi:hypothetical protein